MKYLICAILFSTFLLSIPAHANDWYTELDVLGNRVKVSDTKFTSYMPKLKLGYALMPKVVFELQYATGGEDQSANTTLKVDNITAAYLRLESGVTYGLRIYILAGWAETRLDVTGLNGNKAGTDKYGDSSWGLGIERRIWSKNTFATLEYTKYYHHDNVDITGASLGLRYDY